MRSPDFGRVFYLQTDASINKEIGAVLMQEDKSVRHLVIFISKKLNSAKEPYSTIEKECLAIVNQFKS